jgi:cobalt-zinc-cadmium efflux system outer membrane protein
MNVSRLGGACVVALLLVRLAIGQVQGINSLDELVQMALERNQDYLALKERVTEAQALTRQAGLRPSPTLEVEAGVGAIGGSSGESEYSAAYFQTIERGGKREKRLTVAEKAVALAEAEIRERERQLAFDIKSQAVSVLGQENKLASIRSMLVTNQDSYRLTTQRVELGDAAPLEEQLLLSEVNRTQAQITSAEAARDAGLVELQRIVGLSAVPRLDLAEGLRLGDHEPQLKELQALALEHRSDLLTLKLLEAQAAAETSLASAEGKRNLTASARYTRSRSSFDQFGLSESGAIVPLRDTDNIITFGLSIPLFTKSRAQPAIDAAKARQSHQSLRREQLERVIPLEVEAAYRRWIGARRSLELLRTGVVEPSQKSLTVIREAYRLGQLRLFDVLNEQRRLGDLQLSYIDAQTDVGRALAELERAVGGNLP